MEYDWTVARSCPTSVELVRKLPRGATVADIGCYGWLLSEASAASGATLIGVDQAEPPGRPAHARFVHGAGAAIELQDDSCDLVVAGHVLEHVADGVGFAAELLRIVRPGGLLWIESPSELGCQTVSSNDPEDQRFLSFWDDPTHIRPWTPGALYRLAISCQAYPLAIQRSQTGDVPACTMLARKPESVRGKPASRYVTEGRSIWSQSRVRGDLGTAMKLKALCMLGAAVAALATPVTTFAQAAGAAILTVSGRISK